MPEVTDAYTWTVTHADGTVVDEFDDDIDGVHPSARIRFDEVARVVLTPNRAGVPMLGVVVDPSRGQRLILTRRRSVPLSFETGGPTGGRVTTTLIGFQQTVNGRNVRAVLCIDDDGNAVLTSDPEAI